ncbi:MAG: hypothetical protein KKA79_04600 [Nanoarchaeota archaeon]|nr:hypothetical protein [Nanoarchaeota archaeon]MCG2718572.1 hypothetical protein [Nanoarchaeota archaeon]
MKRILTALLVITLLFSIGCVPTDEDNGMKSTGGKGFAFTGKGGLTVEFEDDSPPPINFVNDPIEIVLKLTNKGAIDLQPGDVQASLKGVATTEIFNPSSIESSNDDELLIAELDPTVATIDMGTITYSPEEMFSAEYKPKIEVEVCFPYTTKINADNFWISDKQTDLSGGSISSSDNSAAPVQVKGLEEFKGTNIVRFEFTIENVGDGKVVEDCFSEEDSDPIVELNILQPRGADCETLDGGSSGSVKLISGKKIIRCSVSIDGDENYKTPLVADLYYNYEFEIDKTITIRNIR